MFLNEVKRFDNHCHSEFSNIRLIDSINKIPDIIKTASKLGMAGVALTDHECLCGHLRWIQEEAKLKKAGIIPEDFKCALGNEIYLVDDRDNITKYWHYILIAKNAVGHRALRELSSIAWYKSFSSRGMTRVPTEKRELEDILKKFPNSLIATTACLGGELGGLVLKLVELENDQKNLLNNADEITGVKCAIRDFIMWNKNLFGDDFFIEIAAGQSKDQVKFNKRVKDIAKYYNVNITIGSDSHYLTANERPVHKAYLNSKEGDREVDEFYFDAHMMDNEEAYGNLKNIFTEEEFIEICNNSMKIYDKIEHFSLERSSIIPEIDVKVYSVNNFTGYDNYPIISYLLSSSDSQERYWINQCLEAMKIKDLESDIYLERLEKEADIIKFVGDKLNDCLFKYFNTYQHYIDLFWECGSIVGPGRGSSVCFLSNYLMGITQLDPLVWGLKEWRFLNKERVELPKLNIGQYKIGEHIQWCA
jgi:DNA polymerase-3 subunit alpha